MTILTIQGADPDALVAQIECFGDQAATAFESAAITWLRERDYAISRHGDWETPGRLACRLGVTVKHIIRRRQHVDCPDHGVQLQQSGSGRVKAYASNPDFDAFLTAHIKPTNTNHQ